MANIITELHLEMSDNWYVSKKLNSIGRVGENTVTKLIIEPTEIINNVTYEIEIMGADGSKNVAELTIEGTELYLILTANMLTTSGITKMQVRGLFTDGSIKKSNIFELKVNRSISATEAYEEYAVIIFDQLVQDCRDIIEGAESYAVRAETAAVNAEAYEQSASASASTATTAASNASASATAASTSATSASASATSAAASETNAATSATSANTSASNASTSATNAANSATAAATSATNAHTSEVNASNSETNASTSAAEAEASAESIAASVSQINENTYRINDLEAIIGGYQLTDLPAGTVSTITDGTALLMPSLKVCIEPVQDLHGYDHPWAGGAGKNKAYRIDSVLPMTSNGITVSADSSYGVKVTGTASATIGFNVFEFPVESGETYTVSFGMATISGVYVNLPKFSNGINVGNAGGISVGTPSFTFTADDTFDSVKGRITVDNGINANGIVIIIQAEAGSTATSYEPYSNICPISGWTAANVSVSPTTSAEDGTTYTIEFKDGDNPLTVYGGTLDVTSGELVVDRAMVDLGDLSWGYSGYSATSAYFFATITNKAIGYNNIICSIYKTSAIPGVANLEDKAIVGENSGQAVIVKDSAYSDAASFKTAVNGVQLVYELETPTTYHLTPTQVRTLVGNNNIWADTGDIISGKYYKSLT